MLCACVSHCRTDGSETSINNPLLWDFLMLTLMEWWSFPHMLIHSTPPTICVVWQRLCLFHWGSQNVCVGCVNHTIGCPGTVIILPQTLGPIPGCIDLIKHFCFLFPCLQYHQTTTSQIEPHSPWGGAFFKNAAYVPAHAHLYQEREPLPGRTSQFKNTQAGTM